MTATSTYLCPACAHENPDHYRYCRTCRAQTRCFSCNEPLEANADMCFACGEATRVAPTREGRNTYSLREQSRSGADGSHEHSLAVDFSVETDGLHHLGALLGLAATGTNRRPGTGTTLTVGRQSAGSPSAALALPPHAEDATPAMATTGAEPPASHGNDLMSWVLNRFEAVGTDDVVTTLTNLRGKTARENQLRLMLLYTVAFQALLNRKPDQAQVVAALEKKGLLDKKNISTYYKSMHQTHFVDAGERYRLTDEGERTLAEFVRTFDASADEDPPKATGKAKRSSSGRRITEEERSLVAQLVDGSLHFPGFETKNVKAPRELNALALWLSCRILTGPEALSPRMAYEYLEKMLGGRMPYTPAQVSEGFNKRDNGFFRKNAQGHFLLTDRGESFITEWLATQGHHDLLSRATTHAGDNA